jgi:hypothetical protein
MEKKKKEEENEIKGVHSSLDSRTECKRDLPQVSLGRHKKKESAYFFM